ncbi:MAG: prepilin-type N-terminal cleavage/methylation domain-containing protein [Gammaproteobacteria bacterium]|nr:prepilin-type N-terminal cleavage/methylation domain-containing protein [Gammaproteobacteria bacterium]
MPETSYLHSACRSNVERSRAPNARQRGYSLIEIAFGVAIVAAIAVVAAVFIGDVNKSLNTSQALAQINTLVASARQYRSTFSQGGLYTDLSMAELKDQGYSTGWMDGDSPINVYGLDVTLVETSGSSSKDATLTYDTPSADACALLERSFKRGTDYVNGIKSTACASGVLTLTID